MDLPHHACHLKDPSSLGTFFTLNILSDAFDLLLESFIQGFHVLLFADVLFTRNSVHKLHVTGRLKRRICVQLQNKGSLKNTTLVHNKSYYKDQSSYRNTRRRISPFTKSGSKVRRHHGNPLYMLPAPRLLFPYICFCLHFDL
jgi:hypothetical protein